MTSSRPYRFPALAAGEVDEPARARRLSTRQSCGTCGASAVANCVALCLCPCAVVSCFTLALVKAPYVAGRRWVRLANKRRTRGLLRNTKRVRDFDDQQDHGEGIGGGTARVSKEWGNKLAGRAGAAAAASAWGGNNSDAGVARDGRMRVSTTDKAWMEMYEIGNWGFGRLSFSATGGAPTQVVVKGDPEPEKDDRVAARP